MKGQMSMYILYNKDGSIRKINLTDFIQQGNDNVNSIFLVIEDKTAYDWAASVLFELPNGDVEVVTPVAAVQEVEGEEKSGWLVSIPAAVTIYEGNVKFSVSILNLQGQTLFTYQGKLVINPAAIVPDETKITYSQYEALLQYILTLKFDPSLEIIFATQDQIDNLFD